MFGGCVGIFFEGGSYDWIELLFLKVGVVLMVLGILVDYFDCGFKIVFVGMNYFYVYKFCLRVVVEFGVFLDILWNLVDVYLNGGMEGRCEVVG